jgi:hypothetical protein
MNLQLTQGVLVDGLGAGVIWGIAHTAPQKKLDVRLPDGAICYGVPESALIAITHDAWPHLVRHRG